MIKLKSIFTKLKPLVIPFMWLCILVSSIVMCSENKRLKKEVEIKTNNIEAYQGIVNDQHTKNYILRLDMATLSQSNDKLLHNIDSVANELKISNKRLHTAMSQHTEIVTVQKDTVLISDSCTFDKQFKPNNLTTVNISLRADTISYKLQISNDQYLYIYNERAYKNKGKKFFKRLVTLDWKKITYYKYNIVNTNDLITVGDTRIIENTETK